MPTDQPADKPKHRWLAWVGLQEPPPDLDAWIPVATGRVDDPGKGTSTYSSTIVQALADAGITAHERPYVVPDNSGLAAALLLVNQSVTDRVHVAVLVHNRDTERARVIVGDAHDPSLNGSPITDEQAASLSWGMIPGA